MTFERNSHYDVHMITNARLVVKAPLRGEEHWRMGWSLPCLGSQCHRLQVPSPPPHPLEGQLDSLYTPTEFLIVVDRLIVTCLCENHLNCWKSLLGAIADDRWQRWWWMVVTQENGGWWWRLTMVCEGAGVFEWEVNNKIKSKQK